ncbi:hypothetical protein [Parvularcula oceani]|uniref:hypothetical protein n=1 Tax=Parvularcula oceani TaxID=1247963 RepID=UPI0004E24BAC|nr:hypothetical protein [Parvularcula oceani]
MTRHLRRTLLAFAPLVLLAACATSEPSASFDDLTDAALLIAEVDVSKYDRLVFEMDGEAAVTGNHRVSRTGDRYSWQRGAPSCSALLETNSPRERTVMKLRVPPGEHQLVALIAGCEGMGGMDVATVFTELSPANFTFEVEAGEVLYLGRLRVADHPKTMMPTLSFWGAEETDALGILEGSELSNRLRVYDPGEQPALNALVPEHESTPNRLGSHVIILR